MNENDLIVVASISGQAEVPWSDFLVNMIYLWGRAKQLPTREVLEGFRSLYEQTQRFAGRCLAEGPQCGIASVVIDSPPLEERQWTIFGEMGTEPPPAGERSACSTKRVTVLVQVGAIGEIYGRHGAKSVAGNQANN